MAERLKHTSCIITLCLLGIILAGSTCSNRKGTLQKASRSYYQYLQWKQFDRAAQYIDESEREPFVSKMESAEESYHIVDFRIDRVSLSEAEDTAKVKVTIEYYRYPSVTVRRFHKEEQWNYEDGKWWLDYDY